METVEQRGPKLRTVDALKRMYLQAADSQADARTLSFRDRDWYDNADEWHWTEEEKLELQDRGQPPVSANDIKRNVNFLLGFEQRTRTDPRAFPRKPGDEQPADVATDVLTFAEEQTRFDKTASECFKDFVIEGVEVVEVGYESDITINRIAFEKFFFDPRAREKDFSDARYLGYVDWFDLEEAQALFPDHAEGLKGVFSGTELDEGFEDKPAYWSDVGTQRVRIAVVYYRLPDRSWAYAYYTDGLILSQGLSPYADERGRPCCPIIAQSCYVTRENQRYGVVRDMISPQREKNWRRSLALYLLKSRRMWASDGVFADPAQAKRDAAKADGLLVVNGELGRDWGFIDNMAEASGMLRMGEQAEADLAQLGPNRAAGNPQGASSGRDRALMQNAAVTEENTLFDAHNDWKLRVYRSIWARAKQFWTEQKFVRISEDEKAYRFVAINQPQVMVDPQTGQEVIVGVENAIAEMDVDIIIEAMQDALTLQHEQFEVVMQALPTLTQAPPQWAEIILDMMPNLRDKAKLKERLSEMQQAQAQQSAQMMQLQQQRFQIEMQKLMGEAAGEAADAQKTQVETQGEAIENELRLRAVQMNPWSAKINVGA